MVTGHPEIIVTDASVLMSFLRIDRMDLIADHSVLMNFLRIDRMDLIPTTLSLPIMLPRKSRTDIPSSGNGSAEPPTEAQFRKRASPALRSWPSSDRYLHRGAWGPVSAPPSPDNGAGAAHRPNPPHPHNAGSDGLHDRRGTARHRGGGQHQGRMGCPAPIPSETEQLPGHLPIASPDFVRFVRPCRTLAIAGRYNPKSLSTTISRVGGAWSCSFSVCMPPFRSDGRLGSFVHCPPHSRISFQPLMHMVPVARVCHQMLRLRLERGSG